MRALGERSTARSVCTEMGRAIADSHASTTSSPRLTLVHMEEFELRTLGVEHTDYMWETIVWALSWRGPPKDEERVRADIRFQPIVEGWGRAGDIGLISLTGDDEYAGAAWVRHYEVGGVVPGAVKEGVPALAIGLRPEYRGIGLGTRLLADLMARVKDHGHTEMSLGVERENVVARALYERAGFVVVGDDPPEADLRSGMLEMVAGL